MSLFQKYKILRKKFIKLVGKNEADAFFKRLFKKVKFKTWNIWNK